MNCPNCGKQIEENTKFCMYCGYDISLATNNEAGSTPRNNETWREYIIPIICCLIVFFVLFGITLCFQDETDIGVDNNVKRTSEDRNVDNREYQELEDFFSNPNAVTDVEIQYYDDDVTNPGFTVTEYNYKGAQLRQTAYSYNGEIRYSVEYEYYEEDGGINGYIETHCSADSESEEGYSINVIEENKYKNNQRIFYKETFPKTGEVEEKTYEYDETKEFNFIEDTTHVEKEGSYTRLGSLVNRSDYYDNYVIYDTWGREVLCISFWLDGSYQSYMETWYEDADYTLERYSVFKKPYDLSKYRNLLVSYEMNETEFLGEFGYLNDTIGYTSDEELCELSRKYYIAHKGYEPPCVDVDHSEGDEVMIHLYEDVNDEEGGHLATFDWYWINRKTLKGTDFMGRDIDLRE